MKRDTILVVDDIEINRIILREILSDRYDIIEACDGREAVDMIISRAHEISLVLLDIMMPEMDGYEVLTRLNLGGYTGVIPIIIITASGGDDNELRGLEMGAVDFVNKPFNPDIIRCRVKTQVELKKHQDNMEELVDEGIKKLTRMQETMVEFLASVIEYRHVESGQHCKRTRLMVERLLHHIRRSGLMNEELSLVDPSLIGRAVPLHDIGKIGIPDHILLKPGRLTIEEFDVIKTHTTIGAELVDRMRSIEEPEYIQYSKDICLSHHERWDGTGYPHGLKGKDIPFAARLMSIVDVYDALVNERVYKPAMPHEEALDILREGSGKQFDPVAVQVFIDNASDFAIGEEVE